MLLCLMHLFLFLCSVLVVFSCLQIRSLYSVTLLPLIELLLPYLVSVGRGAPTGSGAGSRHGSRPASGTHARSRSLRDTPSFNHPAPAPSAFLTPQPPSYTAPMDAGGRTKRHSVPRAPSPTLRLPSGGKGEADEAFPRRASHRGSLRLDNTDLIAIPGNSNNMESLTGSFKAKKTEKQQNTNTK